MQRVNLNQNFGIAYQQWYDMKTAAKLIDAQMGRTMLFRFLREERFLMNDNVPYQTYVDKGWFRITVKNIYGNYGQLLFRSVVTLVSDSGIDAVKTAILNRSLRD